MEPSQSSTKSELTLLGSVRSGTVSGLVAAWAIFGMILAVGAQLGSATWYIYQMVGVSLGIDEEWPAIYLGFVMHMITGAIIGIVYMIISDRVRKASNRFFYSQGVCNRSCNWHSSLGGSICSVALFSDGTNSTKHAFDIITRIASNK